MDIEELLIGEALAFLPIIVLGWIIYLFNNRNKTKRILQVESENVNETVLFAGLRAFSSINIISPTPVSVFGIAFFLKRLSPDIVEGFFNMVYLVLAVGFVCMLLVVRWTYKKKPLVIFTMRKVYLFPWYGLSAVSQSYDLDSLRWTEEEVEKGTLIRLYAGEELVCDTGEMPRGVDDFVREHVKPKEA